MAIWTDTGQLANKAYGDIGYANQSWKWGFAGQFTNKAYGEAGYANQSWKWGFAGQIAKFLNEGMEANMDEFPLAKNIIQIINSDDTVDLIGKQGSSWGWELALTNDDDMPINLTGYSVRGHIRKKYTSADITADIACEIKTPATDGKISLTVDAETTAVIAAYKDTIDSSKLKKIPLAADGVYVYDIEIVSGTKVTRIMEGRFYIDPEATK